VTHYEHAAQTTSLANSADKSEAGYFHATITSLNERASDETFIKARSKRRKLFLAQNLFMSYANIQHFDVYRYVKVMFTQRRDNSRHHSSKQAKSLLSFSHIHSHTLTHTHTCENGIEKFINNKPAWKGLLLLLLL